MLSFVILLVTGVVAANFFGQRLILGWEALLGRIPFVKSIYSSVKQVSDTLLSDTGNAFRKALLVEFPRPGCWTIAFLTGTPADAVAAHLDGEHISIYVPTTPNPTGGYFVMVPKASARELDMSVDEALKYIISMGVVAPKHRTAAPAARRSSPPPRRRPHPRPWRRRSARTPPPTREIDRAGREGRRVAAPALSPRPPPFPHHRIQPNPFSGERLETHRLLRPHRAAATSRQTVTLMGWVHRRRDHGGVIFIDLRDREGLVQIVCDPDRAETFAVAEKLRNEFVISVTGLVRPRPEGTVNPNLVSGEIEVLAHEITILNAALTPPFQLDDENLSETVRLANRVLDLRRPPMQKNLMLRYRAAMSARRYFDAPGLHRHRDPDAVQVHARGRARVPRALAHPPRHVLRAAAVAAAVQADADDGGLRPLLPDLQVLSATRTCAPTASPSSRRSTWRRRSCPSSRSARSWKASCARCSRRRSTSTCRTRSRS